MSPVRTSRPGLPSMTTTIVGRKHFEKLLVCPNRHLGLGVQRAQEELADKFRGLHYKAVQHRQLDDA